MNDSRIDPELLSRYIEGEVSEEEKRDVEATLAVSAEARGQLETLRKMLVTLGRLPDHQALEAKDAAHF